MADLCISRLPYRWWRQRLLTALTANEDLSGNPAEKNSLRRTLKMYHLAQRNYPFSTNCLRRGLALQRLLSSQNVPSRLVTGIKLSLEQTTGHAWVQYGDQIINDSPAVSKHYVLLDNFENIKEILPHLDNNTAN